MDTMRIGKYKGKTIKWIRDNQPVHFNWIRENNDGLLYDYDVIVYDKEVNKKFASVRVAKSFSDAAHDHIMDQGSYLGY